MCLRVRTIAAAAIAALVAMGQARATDITPCYGTPMQAGLDRGAKLIQRTEIKYPKSEADKWGEGWVRLGLTVAEDGTPTNIRVHDALGSPNYSKAAITGWSQMRYEPAIFDGEPIDLHGLEVDIEFQLNGENRAGIHARYETNYDRAFKLRAAGRHREALDVLKQNFAMSLNLYELATTSYAMAVTHLRLNDRHRALRHIRHATLADGHFADRGVRQAALTMKIELEAQNNSLAAVSCTYDKLIEMYPAQRDNTSLAAIVATARQRLADQVALRTEVELVETDRPDLAPSWRRRLYRRTAFITQTKGRLERFVVSCPTVEIEKPLVAERSEIALDEYAATCNLTVFGKPGAKFVLDER